MTRGRRINAYPHDAAGKRLYAKIKNVKIYSNVAYREAPAKLGSMEAHDYASDDVLQWKERADGHWSASAHGLHYDVAPDHRGGHTTWVRVDNDWKRLGRFPTLGGAFGAAKRYADQASKASEGGCSHTHPPEVPSIPCPEEGGVKTAWAGREKVPVIHESPMAKEGLEIVERDVEKARAGRRKGKIKTAKDVYNLLHPTLVKQSVEVFVVVPLDIHGRPLTPTGVEVARGQTDQVSVDPAQVLAPVVSMNARGFICAHSHPSGAGKASQADVELTKKINEAARALDKVCLDHAVIGDGQYESIREVYGKKAGF